MHIVLEKKDCSNIIDAIIQSGESGTITSLVISGFSFGVCYDLEVEYSHEDDYFNGTGAYYCESVYCSIMDIWLEEEDVAIDIDTTYIENEVEKHFRNILKRDYENKRKSNWYLLLQEMGKKPRHYVRRCRETYELLW